MNKAVLAQATPLERTMDSIVPVRPKGLLNKIKLALGRRVVVLFALSVPLGLGVGFGEILVGVALYNVLAHFNLVSGAQSSAVWKIPSFGDPILFLIVVAAGVSAVRFCSQLVPSLANEAFATRMRLAISELVLGGHRIHRGIPFATANHILTNVSVRSASAINAFSRILVALFLLSTVLAGLINLSWRLSLIVIVAVAIMPLPLLLVRRRQRELSEKISDNLREFTLRIAKDARHSHFLRVIGANEHALEALCALCSKISRDYVGWLSRISVISNIPPFLATIVIVGTLWANDAWAGLSVAALVPFVYLLARLASATAEVMAAFGQIQYGLPYVRELLAFVEQLFPDDQAEKLGRRDPISLTQLTATQLVAGYDAPLVSGLDISVSAGDTLLVTGVSGRGKTTLLMTLIGLVEPLSGTVRWNGVPCAEFDPTKFRAKLGYVGPEPYLFDGTIESNLLFGHRGNEIDAAELRHALECARAEFVFSLDGGLSHKLSEGGEGISAGQRQRLSLARALLRNPEVLLLDEATANIDEDNEREIMSRIRQEFPHLIILAVSHRNSMRQFATVQLEI